jgi:hypothetical protein
MDAYDWRIRQPVKPQLPFVAARENRRWEAVVRGKIMVLAALGALAGAAQAHATIDAAFLSPFMEMPAPDTSAQAAQLGEFSPTFSEPTIGGKPTMQRCIAKDGSDRPANPALGPPGDARYLDCKPTAASVNVLPDGRVMYYDGLEGTEQIRTSIVLEYGHNAGNDQSRVLDVSGPSWSVPGAADGGANPGGYPNQALFPAPLSDTDPSNDGALFCSDNKFLPDGRVIALGGTAYYTDPGVGANGSNYGVSELEGLRNARIFDPVTRSWSQSGAMKYGRWYPTAITLADGRLLVASGVTKLLKPAYPSHPTDSGTNVTETETYDPATGKWTENPATASRDLPLFPRLHLLPDGKVFYNAAGQSFNPAGQSYGEALWNEAAVYDPRAQSWTQLGVPGLESAPSGPPSGLGNPAGDVQGTGIPGLGPDIAIPGFRGSTFSIMLPLRPDASGSYASASFLTAGGVLNPPSPGSYFATSDSRITTIDTAHGDLMSTVPTGDLGEPRWYASGVLLPTGEVLAFNGSDRDEVAGPGVEFPVQKTELFDPATKTWTALASSHQPRTYHNTAALLPDGRVLIGGHAPISTLYANDTTIPGGFAPHDGRDPSFEIYSPPYLFKGPRPRIDNAPGLDRIAYGSTFHVNTHEADDIDSVVLVRNPSVTHLIDADQRNVVLRVTKRAGDDLAVAAPPNGAVAPPGPYMLFVIRDGVPSKAAQTFVGV